IHAYLMALLYVRSGRRVPEPPAKSPLLPVTIQLPVYNERYVIGRLLDAVTRLDYPRDLLEIQVLDDSTDDTALEASVLVSRLSARGWHAVHRHRRERTGYKGGALREGLAEARGSLVAIFDADFLPPPHFLRATVPYFQDPGIGMVQTRWTHLNEGFSVLTRAQAAALDGHFLIEHAVRNRHGAFINFNGTAGIWRKECILAAGDWQDDTLTEDLDLSYRAQLAGWKFLFVPHIECPAELPAEVNGLKGQQFRWAKGSAQTALKILPRLASARLPAFVRFQALVHLTNHLVYPLLLLLGFMALPALWILDRHPETGTLFSLATVLAVASFGHPWLYLVAQRSQGRRFPEACLMVAYVVAGNLGIALNNTRALVEGLAGFQSDFIRTPKYGLTSRADHWRGKAYHPPASLWPLLEIVFAAYGVAGLAYALGHGHWLAVPILILYVLGSGTLGALSMYNAWTRSREDRGGAPALAPALPPGN
ncbi:MAG TPA: glycosyltransferase, partial [Candidatus Eisenbacteria bacterium]|nr:glycosyltransferase [Candidatus Eisenbacteria bacterium]